MNLDRTSFKQISADTDKRENDPHISPDGTKIVFFRNVDSEPAESMLDFVQEDWHIIIVDLETGEENDISPEGIIDSVPEWAGDSETLIFWHLDAERKELPVMYTMKYDGSERKMLKAPAGYESYTTLHFFQAVIQR